MLVWEERILFCTNYTINSLKSEDSYIQSCFKEEVDMENVYKKIIIQCDALSNRLIEKAGFEYYDTKREMLFGCYQKSCNLDDNNNGFDIVIIIEDYSIIMKEIYEKLFPEVNKIIIVSESKMNDFDWYISLQMDDLKCASFTLIDNNSDNLEAVLAAGCDTKELKKDCQDFEN